MILWQLFTGILRSINSHLIIHKNLVYNNQWSKRWVFLWHNERAGFLAVENQTGYFIEPVNHSLSAIYKTFLSELIVRLMHSIHSLVSYIIVTRWKNQGCFTSASMIRTTDHHQKARLQKCFIHGNNVRDRWSKGLNLKPFTLED